MDSGTLGCFGSLKIEILCQKSAGKSRYPELIYKTYCLFPQGYSSAPSMFNRGYLLAFKRQAINKEISLGFTILGQSQH